MAQTTGNLVIQPSGVRGAPRAMFNNPGHSSDLQVNSEYLLAAESQAHKADLGLLARRSI